MADLKAWPARDREWVAHYRTAMAGKHVPAVALEERELELLDGVCEAELPAAEVFGAADTLAAEDVAELATVDEAVRTSEGGGLRPALLGLGLLAPGVVALVAATRMPQQTLRESWDDADWVSRFRGGLRARLVPAATARGHVAEIEQAMGFGRESAYAEFGHPLVLARELAEADRTARARRWWVSTVAGTGTPLVIAALVFVMESW